MSRWGELRRVFESALKLDGEERERFLAKACGDDDALLAAGPDQLLEIEDALLRLEAEAPRQARVVECRFFAGLKDREIAAVLDISIPTVQRDWRVARAWLGATLGR